MLNENLKLPFPISLEHIAYLWQHSDVLIFLVDLDDYNTFNTCYLNRIELESLERLQTSHFKKRYIISRTVLKHILCNVTGERSVSGISTYKDRHGKVCIRNHNELYICISYTESLAALAISKVEVGIDIELGKKLSLKSNLKNLCTKSSCTDEPASETDLLKTWTLKEAYSKFSNKNMHLIFNKELDLSNVSHSTFVLDNKYIFSVITHSDSHIININRLHKIHCNWD
ncbi:4'-phosphopantetheinyl transferase family protein [Methanosarcina sp.]|uniref:4'-phosphopantetheinyl transferase family protein n=1 Tax=Methanosarcina sp. TaxID=2213 RepID=UPI003C760C87